MMHSLMLTTEELRLMFITTGTKPLISDSVKEQMMRHLTIADQTRDNLDNTNEDKIIQL
jgi:hypothetical protein|tara:strand:- start:264 stop:440 length:177 start_codon:yes stop_codon:yes gene_type:complete